MDISSITWCGTKEPNFRFFRKTLKIQILDSLSAENCFLSICVYSHASLHMAIHDVAGGRVYHVWDITREFLDHNVVSGLCKLKPKNLF